MSIVQKNKNIIVLLAGALFIRLILSGFGTLALDQNTFIAWGRRAYEVGFYNFYNAWSDYLPGYIYVLALLAKIETFTPIAPTVLYKLPAIIADIVTGYLIYDVLRKRKRVAFIAAAMFLFNPAVIYNSTLWGQVDILTALAAFLAIYSVRRYAASSVFLALGTMVKPQAIMAAPVIFALSLRNKWKIKDYVYYGASFLVALTILFLPFTDIYNLPNFVFTRVNETLGQYPYGSVNAFNFWGLFGFWKPDTEGIVNPNLFGMIAIILASVLVAFKNDLVSKKPYHFLSILFLVNFLFFTRMHERHMLPALAPLVIASAATPVLWIVYWGLSLSYIANMYYSYYWITNDFASFFSPLVIKIIIVANIILFLALVKQTFKPTRKLNFKKLLSVFTRIKSRKMLVKDRLGVKLERLLLVAILVFSLTVRLVRLEVPQKDYFDEIYHAFTARQMLAGDPKPWHWSSAHPEGYAYEWTHPPLAKEIMAGSMALFGVNPFSWRLPGALSGVLIIYATYLIAKKLFKSRDVAILAALAISLDGLVLTMSRIGTADTYLVAFAMVSIYFFLRGNDFLSSVFLGLSAATKWSTLWLLPLFAIIFLTMRREIKYSLLWFIVVPVLIYLLSYIPMFNFGHNLETFWGMQKQMWWYHSGLDATHPYTSPWWSWPIMGRPVYLYQNYSDGIVENIYALGNPFFFWAGLASMIYSVYLLVKERSAALFVIVFGYFVLFAPWALSPRIMFVYHYLPSLPLMAIGLGYILRRYPKTILPVFGLLLMAFVYFFPHWTAIPVGEWLDKSYYWFSSWR